MFNLESEAKFNSESEAKNTTRRQSQSINGSLQQQPSPLNFIAQALWEDFTAGRPIDGGVPFEPQLRQCQLDGSLASLQRLDKLLLFIRKHITQPPQAFMLEDKNRTLLWFIGFYSGNILARSWQSTPNWLGRHELSQYGALKTTHNNPFEFMALDYLPKIHHTSVEYKHLFFVLEPIGRCLFGNENEPMPSVLGDVVEFSLFDAVVQRLPADKKNDIQLKQQQIQAIRKQKDRVQPHKSNEHPKQTPRKQTPLSHELPSTDAFNQSANLALLSPLSAAKGSQKSPSNNSLSNNLANNPINNTNTNTKNNNLAKSNTTRSVANIKSVKRQDDFTELRKELLTLKAPLTEVKGSQEYLKATHILSQFDSYIAKQVQAGKLIDSIELSKAHKQARMQALKLLNQAAQAGNSAAMLRLAIYYFLGEGVPRDENKGFAWVHKSAVAGDLRGQRQLSRLYYKGIGVAQDIDKGLHWLEKAADNEHPEAMVILEQWYASQTIMNEQRYEHSIDQRYYVLIIASIVISLIIAIMI